MQRTIEVQIHGMDAAQWAGVMGMAVLDGGTDWLSRKDFDEPNADETAELAGKLCREAANVDEVRWELVAGLRAAIKAGTYCVEAAEVAGCILRELGAEG